jgi:hypothetical protein
LGFEDFGIKGDICFAETHCTGASAGIYQKWPKRPELDGPDRDIMETNAPDAPPSCKAPGTTARGGKKQRGKGGLECSPRRRRRRRRRGPRRVPQPPPRAARHRGGRLRAPVPATNRAGAGESVGRAERVVGSKNSNKNHRRGRATSKRLGKEASAQKRIRRKEK